MNTEDLIAEIERRILEHRKTIESISAPDPLDFHAAVSATTELQSLLDWIKSKQLNTTK